MFPRRDETFPASTQEEWHEQVKRIVTVTGKDERRQARFSDLNIKLLLQFTNETRLGGFALVKLTAWKLPQPFQRFTTWSLGDEHAPVDIDEGGGGDEDERLHRRLQMRARGVS